MKFFRICLIFALVFSALPVFGHGGREAEIVDGTYPPGTMLLYGYGQPQYWLQFFTNYLEDNPNVGPGVRIQMVQTEGEADARQKAQMSFTAGAYSEMPDAVQTSPVSMQVMAEGGMLEDLTDFIRPMQDLFIPGTFDQVTYKGRIYGLPESLRPQLLFYNQDLFQKYGVDPEMMDTVEGYIEAGRLLKERSNGEVYLSYVDPGSFTWRYYGRRGFMPQANAKIWDDDGNVVIDTDQGARRAFETIATLMEERLLLEVNMFSPPLYEATRNGKIATYYMGAFWDEFMRANLQDMSGSWRAMPAPVYCDIGLRGAPVIGLYSIAKKPGSVYGELYKEIWTDYHFNPESRKRWTDRMADQNAPYFVPITLEMLDDPYWRESSSFYGGQSFREMEIIGLSGSAENMRVTKDDAEADMLISAELELYIAGDQTMEQAISNMGKVLRLQIGSTDPK
ncbi:sugar ABC transporter substrate-binding protein [Alkalispirochaeta sphaeroplastigenens]|uniref:Sugar ABC transporter substrate-binding protein n=1 Tax=Alkalispirochaeta sphaeroplastigenens TaxID=1187066 RepID=A0A2S4JVK2_9SPIO|nr:ABC transporter substrate-binding protein [Alkalispirochaeta sphaeroplastigenens]POR03557.1 sugar ABC transporter substrate-binding protein [Alkalispirochaeta sphaeroplastigenens]